ncbi:MAG: UvrD-helicase domain-containing protein [Acidobacteria bacterium]|nr:UvrD-helicase domain-containing protein [Acidobacteriota bacterium]
MDLLKDLNEEQRRAVELTDGAILVLAGAGSGKTRVLVHRIAHTLHLGLAAPDEIVAVTFTNKSAAEMKERIARLLGEGSAPDRVGTFHSLCLRMLRREAPRLGYRDGFQIFDTEDSLRLVKESLKELVSGDQTATPGDVLRRISSAKNLGVDPDSGEEHWRGPQGPLHARVYAAYQSGLRRMNAMDFDDLILNVIRLFAEHPDRARLWAGTCRYLLVDEYQDTNPPQYRLVRALAAVHGNLCVVGDEDQSIYRFRGADIGNILSFQKDFPGTTVVKLTQNYRSTGSILAAANSLVRNNTQRIGKELWTAAGRGDKVKLAILPGDREEAAFIVRVIQEWRRTARLEEAAILYRTNAQSRLFEEALISAGVPYRIYGSLRFYDRKEIRDLMAYLKLAVNPSDDVAFRRVINVPARGLGAVALEAIDAAAAAGRTSLHDGCRAAIESKALAAKAAASAGAFLAVLESVRGKLAGGSPGEILRQLIRGVDYTEHLKRTEGSEADARLENVEQLVDAAAESAGEGGLQEFLDRASLVSESESAQGTGGANLMTLHSAKGLEFDLVCLVGMEEGLCPHARTLDAADEIEEERRLAYVGMTRARKRLHVTAARTRRTFGEIAPAAISRFLGEIGDENVEEVFTSPAAGTSWGRSALAGGGGAGGGGGARWAARPRREVALGDEDVSREAADDGAAPDDDAAEGGEVPSFRVGARVRHDQFGLGEVLLVEAADEGQKLTVRFGGRTRKLLTRYAHLTRVGS